MPENFKGNSLKNLKEKVEKLRTKLEFHSKLSKVQLSLTKQWQMIFDSIKDALVLIDENGYIIQCNKAMSEIAKKPCLEIIGSLCWEIFHRSCERDKNCLFIKMKEKKGRVQSNFKINGKNYKVVLDPFLNENGDIFGAIHIISEIKKRKKTIH